MQQAIRFLILLCFATLSLQAQVKPSSFDLQGHRGARGLKPENTIPSFLEAIKHGVTTLELDVVITKDKKVILSHEPWMNHNICTKGGSNISGNKLQHNIYKMTYDEVKAYDCGSIGNPRFPEQQAEAVGKPLLSEVFIAIEQYIKDNNLPQIFYNIETKCLPAGDNIFHPKPDEFIELLYRVITEAGLKERVFIQSFDVRTLQSMKAKDGSIPLVLLVSNKKGLTANLKKLGFIPAAYSPNHQLISRELVKDVQQRNMKIIPWTVNDPARMKELKEWGVDGLITDYPNRAAFLIK